MICHWAAHCSYITYVRSEVTKVKFNRELGKTLALRLCYGIFLSQLNAAWELSKITKYTHRQNF